MEKLSLELLKAALTYNPNTGIFTWNVRPESHFASKGQARRWNRKFAGKPAGCKCDTGYLKITIGRVGYRASRIAWFYMTGEWPEGEVDHRDGRRANNRWRNLRDIPGAANRQNTKRQVNNTSGYTGVSWHRASNAWLARIRVDNRRVYLGTFDDPKAAYGAYLAAKRVLHPFQPVPRGEAA